jgi:uncharacterized protein
MRNMVEKVVRSMMLDAPLSDQEADELDAFLESDATPDECMDITALDGFLTAVAIAPGLPPPSTWMPVIWGGKGEPVFHSAEGAQRIVSLIMRRMNMIGARLGQEPPAFEPILLECEVEGGGTIVLAHDWCAGFMAAVELAFDDWQPLVDDQSNSPLLVPFIKLGTDEGRDEINAAEDQRAEYDRLVGTIGLCVTAIDAFWKLRRRKGSAAMREALRRPRSLRPGRNDPCPCDSQRKFKKCCAMRPGP